MQKKMRGFTLIELVLVIAVLGIVAVAALPKLFNISLTTAKNNAMLATVGGIQTGISLYAANQVSTTTTVSYPATLDSAAAGVATWSAPLFGTVLKTPIAMRWIKVSGTCYVYDTNNSSAVDTGDNYYQYTPATGRFAQVNLCT